MGTHETQRGGSRCTASCAPRSCNGVSERLAWAAAYPPEARFFAGMHTESLDLRSGSGPRLGEDTSCSRYKSRSCCDDSAAGTVGEGLGAAAAVGWGEGELGDGLEAKGEAAGFAALCSYAAAVSPVCQVGSW